MQRDNLGKWILGFALLIVLVSAVGVIGGLQERKTIVTIGGQVVHARVADTPERRQQGLSGTNSLGANEGMLFVFDNPSRWGIWMKDMRYDLDIVWLDSAKRVVHVEQHVAPSTYPNTFRPDSDAVYVLELPAGFAAKHNLVRGQAASFSLN